MVYLKIILDIKFVPNLNGNPPLCFHWFTFIHHIFNKNSNLLTLLHIMTCNLVTN